MSLNRVIRTVPIPDDITLSCRSTGHHNKILFRYTLIRSKLLAKGSNISRTCKMTLALCGLFLYSAGKYFNHKKHFFFFLQLIHVCRDKLGLIFKKMCCQNCKYVFKYYLVIFVKLNTCPTHSNFVILVVFV